MSRRPWVLLVLAFVAAGLLPWRATAQEGIEYEVKAAFLYNFARFIEWPESAFPAAEAPIVICVAGVDPFGRVLDDTIRAERIGTRPLALMRLAPTAPLDTCHLLFVSSSERDHYGTVLAGVNARRTVTVGDGPGFLAAGGVIGLFVEDGRVRFAINDRALDSAEFHVSSKLRRVARRAPEGS